MFLVQLGLGLGQARAWVWVGWSSPLFVVLDGLTCIRDMSLSGREY